MLWVWEDLQNEHNFSTISHRLFSFVCVPVFIIYWIYQIGEACDEANSCEWTFGGKKTTITKKNPKNWYCRNQDLLYSEHSGYCPATACWKYLYYKQMQEDQASTQDRYLLQKHFFFKQTEPPDKKINVRNVLFLHLNFSAENKYCQSATSKKKMGGKKARQ